MKIFRIKTYVPAMLMAATLAGASSCVGDLDVEPINPQETMTYDGDAIFNKIYASFSLTGQTGPSGSGDIADIDEGSSEFNRMNWYLNEMTSDEASWIWVNDAGVPDLLHNTYGATNDFATGLYYRLFFTITLCNFYLEQGATGEDAAARAAEVRFIRAMQYYYLMDLYGQGAFTTKVSSELAERYDRKQYFDFVESELLAIDAALKAPGTNTYGRIDKVAAWNLLARLYLNAEVYTGEARNEDALAYAQKVIENGHYQLHTQGAVNPVTGEQLSAYQMLFLADNDRNGAQNEVIFPVIYDGVSTKGYGGTNFLILSTYSSAMDEKIPSGTNCSWGKCTRVRKELLDKFYDGEAPAADNVADMTGSAGDDRALFYGKGYKADIKDEGDADAGFACVKFRNINSDGSSNQVIDFVNTDMPLMRLAEAYLTYAEASTRIKGVNDDAASKINALRDRAHATRKASYSLSDICDEWSREFWFEGRRRMDLIRFGRFGGQAEYKWQWMGGTAEGAQFAATRNVFAIPVNDLNANSNLQQNPGY